MIGDSILWPHEQEMAVEMDLHPALNTWQHNTINVRCKHKIQTTNVMRTQTQEHTTHARYSVLPDYRKRYDMFDANADYRC